MENPTRHIKMRDTTVRLALEEMKIAMHSHHGYSWDHEVGRVMRAVEDYAKSKEDMFPVPRLKWADRQYSDTKEHYLQAEMFGSELWFSARPSGGEWTATFMGLPILRDELGRERYFGTMEEAVSVCEARWEELWSKEFAPPIAIKTPESGETTATIEKSEYERLLAVERAYSILCGEMRSEEKLKDAMCLVFKDAYETGNSHGHDQMKNYQLDDLFDNYWEERRKERDRSNPCQHT